VCNDGVTIAKELVLEDAIENMGAQLLREAAERTGDAVGDGTSTATVLAHAMLVEGVRNVASGASAVDLKKGLDHGLKAALTMLKSISRPVTSRACGDHFGAQQPADWGHGGGCDREDRGRRGGDGGGVEHDGDDA
jgi:chaperonin GroEL (HSP60 family)